MKQKTQYVCKNCGAIYAKWQGRCSSCDEWETIALVEISKETEAQQKATD